MPHEGSAEEGHYKNQPAHVIPSVTIVNEATPLLDSQSTNTTTAPSLLALSSDDPTRRRELIGLGLVAASAVAFTAMATCVKFSSKTLPSFEIVLGRSIVQLILSLLCCAVLGLNPLGRTGVRHWLLFRALVVSIGLALYFYSLTQLHLVIATVLFFLGPIFTAIIASIALNEPFTCFDGFSSLLCLAGVLLVSKPSTLFQHQPPTNGQALRHAFAISCALAGAFMSALAYVAVKKVGKGTHFMVHSVYFGAVSTLISLPCLLILQRPVFPSFDWQGWGLLGLVALFAFAGQCLLNEGLRLAPGGPGIMMRISDVVCASISGMIFFGEYPDMDTILGSTLIVGMTTAHGWTKWQNHFLRVAALRQRRSRDRLASSASTRV